MNGILEGYKMTLSHFCQSGNNVVRHFLPLDAPLAASNRALRREWAAVANATLRRTGDADAAQLAGAETLTAALDLDARTTEPGRRDRKGRAPGFTSLISLPAAISRRARGDDDSAIEAILAGARP
jgi:hypothetical protein